MHVSGARGNTNEIELVVCFLVGLLKRTIFVSNNMTRADAGKQFPLKIIEMLRPSTSTQMVTFQNKS